MHEIIFLKPEIKDLIWGREIWTVSAHKHGDCIVSHGNYEGMHLSELWTNHRELFGNVQGEVFPLLVKQIDAKDDLSIQVHPDDVYAKEHENGSLGKTECWYVLDCNTDGSIIIGHHAKTKQQLKDMIAENKWNELLREIPMKRGDFFQIEPGTIHAIKGNTSIMEIQQSSDVTYRLYDYGRLKDGKPRELHIEKSVDVIKVPYADDKKTNSSAENEELVSCKYYAVHKYHVDGHRKFMQDKPFQIISVIKGEGKIDGHCINAGDSFIIPFGYGEYAVDGDVELLQTQIGGV
ncbi:MAG TPA: mannose-6-phosphate isomerase, class I [Lachnospiraceae bacterium]|nr:mannose-6-phosphate isomerase, class I [Lachnospiraceae bacterium]